MTNEYPERSECDFTIYPPKRMITHHDDQPELDLWEFSYLATPLQEQKDFEARQQKIRDIKLQIADIFLEVEREAKVCIDNPDIRDIIEVIRELAKDLIAEYNLLTK